MWVFHLFGLSKNSMICHPYHRSTFLSSNFDGRNTKMWTKWVVQKLQKRTKWFFLINWGIEGWCIFNFHDYLKKCKKCKNSMLEWTGEKLMYVQQIGKPRTAPVSDSIPGWSAWFPEGTAPRHQQCLLGSSASLPDIWRFPSWNPGLSGRQTSRPEKKERETW